MGCPGRQSGCLPFGARFGGAGPSSNLRTRLTCGETISAWPRSGTANRQPPISPAGHAALRLVRPPSSAVSAVRRSHARRSWPSTSRSLCYSPTSCTRWTSLPRWVPNACARSRPTWWCGQRRWCAATAAPSAVSPAMGHPDHSCCHGGTDRWCGRGRSRRSRSRDRSVGRRAGRRRTGSATSGCCGYAHYWPGRAATRPPTATIGSAIARWRHSWTSEDTSRSPRRCRDAHSHRGPPESLKALTGVRGSDG